jgi:hypothetical protein
MSNELPRPSADPPIFLDQNATAELLGLSSRTLERFRLEGRGPAFRKFGRRVLYAKSDILTWADRRTFTSTSHHDRTRGRRHDHH